MTALWGNCRSKTFDRCRSRALRGIQFDSITREFTVSRDFRPMSIPRKNSSLENREPLGSELSKVHNCCARAFAVKVDTKRLPDFLFSRVDLYHHFRNDAFCDLYNLLKVWKTGKWEVVLCQPLPQTLYHPPSLIPKRPRRAWMPLSWKATTRPVVFFFFLDTALLS